MAHVVSQFYVGKAEMSSFHTIILTKKEGVVTITLNRPERMNALNAQLKEELGSAVLQAEMDPDVRVIIITGAGTKAFCAGKDLKEATEASQSSSEFYASQKKTMQLFRSLDSCSKPVIAAINGLAYGGGAEICLCCDMRYISDTAKIGLTEVNLGIIPAGGGTQRLPRLIGIAAAKDMLFNGKTLGAGAANEIGLVNGVFPANQLMEEVTNIAVKIASKPALAVQSVKRVVDVGMQTDIASGLELELMTASVLFDTEDRKEGMAAFIEKRKPNFNSK